MFARRSVKCNHFTNLWSQRRIISFPWSTFGPEICLGQVWISQRHPKVQFSVLMPIGSITVSWYTSSTRTRLNAQCGRSLIIKYGGLVCWDSIACNQSLFEARQDLFAYELIKVYSIRKALKMLPGLLSSCLQSRGTSWM